MTRIVYAVTGASGHLGRFTVQQLLTRGVPSADIVAIARTRDKVADIAQRGVDVRVADYVQPDTVRTVLGGVNRLLLVSSSEARQRLAQHMNLIAAAKTAGVSRIVYTGVPNADYTNNPLAAEHQNTERALREAGLPFIVLRNGWCTENYTDRLVQYVEASEIVGAAGHGRISAASRQDFAIAAVATLVQSVDGNRAYELGGPAFDLFELADTITKATGVTVTYRDLSVVEYIDTLKRSGLDQNVAEFVAALDASISRGELETNSQDVEHLLGRPATSLAAVIAETQQYHA